jgi:hypothetical protein
MQVKRQAMEYQIRVHCKLHFGRGMMNILRLPEIRVDWVSAKFAELGIGGCRKRKLVVALRDTTGESS